MIPPICNCDDKFRQGTCEVHGTIGKKEYERLMERNPLDIFKAASVSDSPACEMNLKQFNNQPENLEIL